MSTELLARLIERKHQVLTQLRQLTTRQQAFISGNEIEKLLTVLGVKQQLIAELQDVERELSPFRDEDPEQRIWGSGELRQKTQGISAACDELLREILLLEKGSTSDLMMRREETAVRLMGMHAATAAHNAYASPASGASHALDLTSES